jgi:hypothetical protein
MIPYLIGVMKELSQRNWARWDDTEPESARSGSTEKHVQRGEISLCFLFDRAERRMRVIDFRAGPQPGKLEIVQEVAEAEGMERAFVVVERDEAATWTRLGFEREATIPGFYKRSDGYVLGMQIERAPFESGTRIRIRSEGAGGGYESVVRSAQKLARSRKSDGLTKVRIGPARDKDIARAVEYAERSGRTISTLSPFGRQSERRAVLCTARGGYSLLVGLEIEHCFDSSYLDPLVAPRGEKETFMTGLAIEQICADLRQEGIVSAFAIGPMRSPELAAALIVAGFRPTGVLVGHFAGAGEREDGGLWSRKLSNPSP